VMLSGTATSPAPFQVFSGSPYNVPPGQTGMVAVSFIPMSAGTFMTNMVFTSNGGISTNGLVGTALTPGDIGVNPSVLDFGTIATGTTSQMVFVVSNGGGTPVTNGMAVVNGGP